ncbi:MAG TPA: MBL fold metallo-hydrolase [Bryobacteraceae bacterium]|nr:MBL fold metallo-hydrolase [Bryobacteraceae bacterium]
MPAFPPHFDGKRFFNPAAPQARGFLDVLKWKFTSRPQKSPRFIPDVQPSQPPSSIQTAALRVTMVNHSTVLLQQRESHILTDPIWSERASPLASIGPRRHRAPGVRLEDLPRIDLVLLSHNHYDHLDLPTLQKLARLRESRFIVPTGVARLLRGQGIEPIHELDWGESSQLAQTTIHCVPAMHFSARTPFDRNRTLWCGYVIETHARKIYFAADTAFGPHFAQIRDHFGPPHVALLPIGAYEPRWFMSPVHMAADEAARAHEILGAQTSIAIHHGTFQLTDESIDAPAKLLRESTADPSFLILSNGQSVTLD